MKLKQIRVRMFRNILDSGDVAIQPDVTCLVGKNESGKTAFLQAMYRLNPARGNPKFSVLDNYPAWLEKRHRNEGKDLDAVRPVEGTFIWDADDVNVVQEKFGPGVAPQPGQILRLWKTYANEFLWEPGCDEKRAVQNFIGAQKLPAGPSKAFKSLESFEQLATELNAAIVENAQAPENIALLQAFAKKRDELLGKETYSSLLWKRIHPRIPQFLYFADYSKLPYTVKIDEVLNADKDDLGDSQLTARSLLELGGAEDEYLLNPDFERRTRELENVANALTDDVLKYWSQNRELRVEPVITQRTEQRGNGQHAVLDELKIRIRDARHSLTLPFTEHSAGFQWFFSFLAAFSEYEHRTPPVVILLDEPAVGLHARAQADFLRFIEERLSERSTVIYTTHSPFMVQPGQLERVRMVEDKGKEEGSTVSSDVLSRDADTLFPLQSALGYDLVQHLFVAKHNLVVEGTSDYTYLKVLSDHLAAIGGRTSLDSRWSIVPVGGADAIPTFVALLGGHLDITVLVDSRKEGHQRLQRLSSDGRLAKQRIILVGDLLGRKTGDIEDLFSPGEYLQLYNTAFGSKLTESELTGDDAIVLKIARKIGVERFDHGKPADVFLRERDKILPKLSAETLARFEKLFATINKTL